MKKKKKPGKDRNRIARELWATKTAQKNIIDIQRAVHQQSMVIREQFAKFVQLIDLFVDETETAINAAMDAADCCPLCNGQDDHKENCPAAMCQEVDKHIRGLYKMLNVEFVKKEPTANINEALLSPQQSQPGPQ